MRLQLQSAGQDWLSLPPGSGDKRHIISPFPSFVAPLVSETFFVCNNTVNFVLMTEFLELIQNKTKNKECRFKRNWPRGSKTVSHDSQGSQRK